MLVSTWVMANDGMLRRDPVIRGVDPATGMEYFICFDDREPPEFVLGVGTRRLTDDDVREAAGRIADGLGVACIVGPDVMRSTRCFGADPASSPYRRAAAVWLDILRPLPAGLMRGETAVQPRGGECVVYSFGERWG